MDILTYYENDTSPNKPKLIKKGGKYTKKFLRYNRKLILGGQVSNYIDEDFIFNTATKRAIKKEYDRRYKNKKVLKKSFKEKYNFTNNIISYGVEVRYKFTGDENEGIIKKILSENNLSGDLKFIFYSPVEIYNEEVQINKGVFKDMNFKIEGSLNKWWKKNAQNFMVSYDPMIWIWLSGFEMIITKETKLKKRVQNQLFRDGKNYYCFYSVIIEHFENALKNAKSQSYKDKLQEKLNYIQGKHLKKGFKYGILQKYKGAMPDDKELLTTLSNKLEVGFDIEMPFQEETFLRIRPHRTAKKVFRYINSRLNHLEVIETNTKFNNLYNNDFKEVEYLEREQLYNLLEYNKKNDIMSIYGKDAWGVSKIKTTKNYYSVKSDFYDTIKNFEEEIGFEENFYVDKNLDIDLTNFLIDATHYNLTSDFKDCSLISCVNDDNIKHIDMKKAYSQFYNCKYYNGFMGIVTDAIRPCNDWKNKKGCFFITNLFIPNGKFKKLNEKMGIYFSNNIYYDTELKFLEDMGCSFNVLYSVLGEKFDFRFNKDMLEKKEIVKVGNQEFPIPYYSKYCGLLGMIRDNKNFYMKGKKEYFQNLRGDFDIYNDEGDEFRVTYKKKYIKHAIHITGQITAYQRLNMIEQLLNMDLDKIIRVCVDGIYYYNHNFKKCEKVQFDFDKKKKDFSLWSDCDNFISNVLDNNEKYSWNIEDRIKRDYNKVEVHKGMGGGGKTHSLLIDKSIYNAVYIAPSWFLSCDKKEEYNLKNNNVLERFVNKKLPYMKELIKKYSCLICDEASMYNEEQKKILMDNFRGRIYFCGDFTYQLPPVKGDEMNIEGLPTYTHNKCYRVVDDKFLKILKGVRKMRDYEKENNIQIYDFSDIYKQFNNITFDEVKKLYKVEDTIITSQNNHIEEINEHIDLEKYLVKNNTLKYKNGQILLKNPNIKAVKIEKTNAFTIHKVQGKTSYNKLFIDKRNMKSIRMIYTALSRAKKKDQIYFF